MPIVLLCGACGDNLLVGEEQDPPVGQAEVEQTDVLFAPDVCSARTWPTVQFPTGDVDLSVTPTATGAAIFAVERIGGPLMGFTIDGRGEIDSKAEGVIIRDDMPYTAVSAAYIDERLITAAVNPNGIEIDMIRPDLGAHVTLASASGEFIADTAMTRTRADRFVTVGDVNGVRGLRFDTAWQQASTQALGGQKIQSMTSAKYFDDTLAVYSTSSTCTLDRVAAGVVSEREFPCLDSRLAVSTTTRRGFMVYEEGDQVMLSEILIGGHSEIANTRLLVDHASAPKIVYDGVRYWVSYLDARKDVVIGYLNGNNDLVSMALEGTQPLANSYELAFLNGAVWIFSVDGNGVGAQRLCLRAIR